MKNELKLFKSEQFGKVRSLEQNGEVLFVAADVCRALGLTNPTMSVQQLDVDEKAKLNLGLSGGSTNCVNEYGLYNLVLASRKPEAKAFKRWITHEVIPAIRKTGKYMAAKQTNELQQQRVEAMLLNAKSRQSKLWLTIAEKTDLPEYKHICQQKAAEVLSGVPLLPMEEAGEKTYSATDIGKMIGVSGNKIGKIANQHNLKIPQYGKLFYSKSEYSCKEVETFRYYANAIPVIKSFLSKEPSLEIIEGGVRQ